MEFDKDTKKLLRNILLGAAGGGLAGHYFSDKDNRTTNAVGGALLGGGLSGLATHFANQKDPKTITAKDLSVDHAFFNELRGAEVGEPEYKQIGYTTADGIRAALAKTIGTGTFTDLAPEPLSWGSYLIPYAGQALAANDAVVNGVNLLNPADMTYTQRAGYGLGVLIPGGSFAKRAPKYLKNIGSKFPSLAKLTAAGAELSAKVSPGTRISKYLDAVGTGGLLAGAGADALAYGGTAGVNARLRHMKDWKEKNPEQFELVRKYGNLDSGLIARARGDEQGLVTILAQAYNRKQPGLENEYLSKLDSIGGGYFK